jgi:hypothetical protein
LAEQKRLRDAAPNLMFNKGGLSKMSQTITFSYVFPSHLQKSEGKKIAPTLMLYFIRLKRSWFDILGLQPEPHLNF